jgi:DNA polymerase III delta prime subunit
MIDTRLILVEGPPGSGKTTTAGKLAAEIANTGKACQCFWEWDPNNPIVIGDDLHLDQVIATAITREADVLQQWQQLVNRQRSQDTVTIMESRFWQTGVMLMYVAGHPLEGVLESNQRLITVIQELQPVLIYFTIDDLPGFTARTIQSKEVDWQQSGLPGGWAEHIFAAFEGQPWSVAHGAIGPDGMIALLEDWALVAERLYERVPFPKVKIRNPYQDWDSALAQVCRFLNLA